MAVEELTKQEQRALEHLQQAQALGVSLREYAEAHGLDVKDLYYRKARLIRKGLLAGRDGLPRQFVPVEVKPGIAEDPETFRLTHSSGWTIECARLPEATWVASLVRAMSEA